MFYVKKELRRTEAPTSVLESLALSKDASWSEPEATNCPLLNVDTDAVPTGWVRNEGCRRLLEHVLSAACCNSLSVAIDVAQVKIAAVVSPGRIHLVGEDAQAVCIDVESPGHHRLVCSAERQRE